MKVQDHTRKWSLLDQSKSATKRGSADFISTRITTADPKNFASKDMNTQFKIKRSH